MRSLSLKRKFDGVLARDSFFHLKPDDQRRMFAIFAAHAAPSAYLMFNTGPAYGEAIGDYRGEPLYHASLDAAEMKHCSRNPGSALLFMLLKIENGGGRIVWLAAKAKPVAARALRKH